MKHECCDPCDTKWALNKIEFSSVSLVNVPENDLQNTVCFCFFAAAHLRPGQAKKPDLRGGAPHTPQRAPKKHVLLRLLFTQAILTLWSTSAVTGTAPLCFNLSNKCLHNFDAQLWCLVLLGIPLMQVNLTSNASNWSMSAVAGALPLIKWHCNFDPCFVKTSFNASQPHVA